MSSATQPATAPELRYAVSPIHEVVFRDAQATGDGSWLIEGYAAVFDQETVLYDGRFYQLTESIAPGAFADALSRTTLPAADPDRTLVHLNFGHDMNRAVAATDVSGIGGLTLSEDTQGLKFTARIDRADPDAQAMAVKMSRGIIRQASFAFTVGEEESTIRDLPDGREMESRRILAIGELYDVCACAQGAYPQTVSQLRSYAAAIGRSPEGEGPPRRSQEGASNVADESQGGRGDQATSSQLTVARLRARRQRMAHPQRTP